LETLFTGNVGHFDDSPMVFHSVVGSITKILAQSLANSVTVEPQTRNTHRFVAIDELRCQSRLSCSGTSEQPNDLFLGFQLLPRNFVLFCLLQHPSARNGVTVLQLTDLIHDLLPTEVTVFYKMVVRV